MTLDDYPHFEIIEGENEITLSRADVTGDRGMIVYNVGKLFPKDEPADPGDGARKAVLQTVLEAWSLGEAAAIFPDELNAMTQLSKRTLKRLKRWSYIRNTGCEPPKKTSLS